MTIDDAEAWDENGNVLTFKYDESGKIIVKDVRKPTAEDYKPVAPLLGVTPDATPEEKQRAEEFMAKQRALVDALHPEFPAF